MKFDCDTYYPRTRLNADSIYILYACWLFPVDTQQNTNTNGNTENRVIRTHMMKNVLKTWVGGSEKEIWGFNKYDEYFFSNRTPNEKVQCNLNVQLPKANINLWIFMIYKLICFIYASFGNILYFSSIFSCVQNKNIK